MRGKQILLQEKVKTLAHCLPLRGHRHSRVLTAGIIQMAIQKCVKHFIRLPVPEVLFICSQKILRVLSPVVAERHVGIVNPESKPVNIRTPYIVLHF